MTTITIKPIIKRIAATTSLTTQYVCPALQTVIDKFTVTNSSGGNATISVYLVNSNDTPSNVRNCVLNTRTLVANETYSCPELVGQVLETGDYIATQTTVASMVVSATGRELS